ncbi:hypothetical protein DM02DRAFT_101923 [Periconia macrospinosa]|uniref:Uncharacterized protein n=1 Tax=Periconia macrospinosa TaxID=97972 RepID=A0A2V1DFI0_9PLEO|nr:hypothetical protein DM02DRAFT_101923 [Periconia macrospinosa]
MLSELVKDMRSAPHRTAPNRTRTCMCVCMYVCMHSSGRQATLTPIDYPHYYSYYCS